MNTIDSSLHGSDEVTKKSVISAHKDILKRKDDLSEVLQPTGVKIYPPVELSWPAFQEDAWQLAQDVELADNLLIM